MRTPQAGVGSSDDSEDGERTPSRKRSYGKSLLCVSVSATVATTCVVCLWWLSILRRTQNVSGGPGQSFELDELARVAALATVHLKDADSLRWRWVELPKRVPVDEGEQVETEEIVRGDKCTAACEAKEPCKYVIICGGRCNMKTRDITPYVQTVQNSWCSSWVYTNIPYLPRDPRLMEPSDAPLLTFYMYRTQGPPNPEGDYPLENVNAASIGGVMWYLHNEMIKDCSYGGKMGERRFGVTRIRRFKVTMKATQPLYDKGMNFGKLCSFDSGECTGPHRSGWAGIGSGWNSKGEWDDFGFFVGCGKLGSFPHEDWLSGRRYEDAIWYHLPGPCPTMNYHRAIEQCNVDLPGGMCDKVTGQGNCTYRVEPAGEIDIDELVGIRPSWSSRADYCRVCAEGSAISPLQFGPQDNYDDLTRQRCITWWANIWNPLENKARVEKALDAFHLKYPDMPTEEQIRAPPCDFDRHRYFH